MPATQAPTRPLLYSPDLFAYRRRRTRVVNVGRVAVGGANPLRLQSMTTTRTQDTESTVNQALRLVQAGCEIVRITAPTEVDAKNLKHIAAALRAKGVDVPLVADIHFRPEAALEAAEHVEKVRVNPGNFSDAKAFKVKEYTDAEYDAELARLEERFTPLVLKLKRLGRALRIGTNHGSLSDRVLNRHGDTPEGMVESALEFVRICEKNDFHDIILSMKASNPKVMIAAYRLLAARMAELGMDYPFHLGVTEAGDGEDGRIKSAAGIGSLLEDGIGDTLRVSLTEDPELEIPPARLLATPYNERVDKIFFCPPAEAAPAGNFARYERRPTHAIQAGPLRLGGEDPVRVSQRISSRGLTAEAFLTLLERRLKAARPIPELLEWEIRDPADIQAMAAFRRKLAAETGRLAFLARWQSPGAPPSELWEAADGTVLPVRDGDEASLAGRSARAAGKPLFLEAADPHALLSSARAAAAHTRDLVLVPADADSSRALRLTRRLVAEKWIADNGFPLLLKSPAPAGEEGLLRAATLMGALLCDGLGDAVQWDTDRPFEADLDALYNLLQGAGARATKAEFVSCPSCGRTLFDLQAVTDRIKKRTGHLKGVKIAIMGCIVNGPGEMADADFGYVGGGPGKINLYVGKDCVEKGLPMDQADERLVALIKSRGRWTDPPPLT